MTEQQPNNGTAIRPTRARARLREVRTRLATRRARRRALRAAEDRYFDEQTTAAWLLWSVLPAAHTVGERVEALTALIDSTTAMAEALAMCDDELADDHGRTAADWARSETALISLVRAAEQALARGTVEWDQFVPEQVPRELAVAAAPICRLLASPANTPEDRAELVCDLYPRVEPLVGDQAAETVVALAAAYWQIAGLTPEQSRARAWRQP